MKVSELIEQLQKLPQDVEVAYYMYDEEYGTAGYAPVERIQYREEVEVFDHHVPVDKNTVRSVYREEPWVILYYKDDEERQYNSVGRLYGRSVYIKQED